MRAQQGSDVSTFGPFSGPMNFYLGGLDSWPTSLNPFKAATRCQLEILGLMSRRAQAYMEVPSRLGQCHMPQDVINEQMRFWRTAFEQYSESSRRILEVTTEAALTPLARRTTGRNGERDYITFPDAKDLNGHDTPQQRLGRQKRVA